MRYMLSHQVTKARRKSLVYEPITLREEEIAGAVVEAAFRVHSSLGPGLLEKVYEACFCHELSKMSFHPRRQVDVPIAYDGVVFDEGLRLDVLIDDLVICEPKAVDVMNPVWDAQILSHLKLTGKRLGFLINFNVSLIKDGIKRFIL
jgi:GxxExxY protein